MKKLMKAMTLVGCICWLWLATGCSSANLEEVKKVAPARWQELGFQIVGYEGYRWGQHLAPGYGGAQVWYTLHRIPDNGITYTGSLQKWGNEYHNTAMAAYDALKP